VNNTLIIGLMVALVIGGIGAWQMSAVKKPASKRKQNSKKIKKWVQIFAKLDAFPLTSNGVRRICKSLTALSVYSIREVYALSARMYVTSRCIIFIIIVAAFIVYDDMLAVLICAVFAISIDGVRLIKKIDNITALVYRELRKAISSIRQEFLRLGSVPEAIQEAEYSDILRGIFDDIYAILTTANGELRLKEFFEKVPFRPIQTLARVCYDINNIGDEIDAYGQSNFVQALTYLSEDINMELSRMRYQKQKFGIIEYLALIPVPFIKIIENFFKGIMPGTSLIYDGTIGYIIRTITLILSIVCYNVIARINTTQSIKEDDRNYLFLKMLKNKKLKHFIIDIAPKNIKRKRLEKRLQKCLSRKKVEELYLTKLVGAIAVFFISILTFATTVQMSKYHLLNSVQQLSLVASNEMDNYPKEKILEMDNTYIALRDSGENLEGKALHTFIGSYMPGLTDLQILDQESRLQRKYDSLKNTYFKWYYIPVSFMLSFIGWFLPNISLKMRAWLVNTESEDDFLQLQTLMTIIMNIDCDTLDALEQMCMASKIHKDMLLYCYHSFPSNPELELARLEAKTPLVEFKRFIGKLRLTVSDLSLKEAFSDLGIERSYLMNIRDMTMRTTIDKKRQLCGILSLTPLIVLVIGIFVLPIGYLGYLEFTKALGYLKEL